MDYIAKHLADQYFAMSDREADNLPNMPNQSEPTWYWVDKFWRLGVMCDYARIQR